MVEPLAASALNSFFTGCSTLRPPVSLSSVGRVTTAATNASWSGTPALRPLKRVKGKGRAADWEHVCKGHPSQCFEWSCCASSQWTWCQAWHRLTMLQELDEFSRRQTVHHQTPQPFLSRLPRVSAFLRESPRRHVSSAVKVAQLNTQPARYHEPSSTLAPAPAVPSQHRCLLLARQLRAISQMPPSSFDLGEAWVAYTEAEEGAALSMVHVAHLLSLFDSVMITIENYCLRTDLTAAKEWGERVQGALHQLRHRIAPQSIFDYRRQLLMVRALASQGDLQEAIRLVHIVPPLTQPQIEEERRRLLAAYETIIFSTWRYLDGSHVLEFILEEWPVIGPILVKNATHRINPLHPSLGRSLRHTSFTILSEVQHPAILLASHRSLDKDRRQQMGNLLLEMLYHQQLPREALDLFQEMEKQRIPPPMSMQLRLIQSLAQDDQFEDANILFQSLPNNSSTRYYLRTGLFLYSRQGDTVRAEEFYHSLANYGWAVAHDIARLIFAYAVHGDTQQVLKLFHQFFPEGSDGRSMNNPDRLHYSYVMYAHAQRGDMAGVSTWLEVMRKSNCSPDVHVYTVILRSLALQGDLDSMATVLEQMRVAKIYPNAVTYTTIITLLAHRKDPVGAEKLYRRAIAEGVVPDRRMISSIMNAHAEAGSWRGVIRIFDYLRSSNVPQLRLTLEVYNTLLKAYVLMGAPFRIVSSLFSRLESSGVRPDAYTFAILVQSACDANLMDVASDIFAELDKLAMNQRPSLVNAYILTIIMAGYLRVGNKIRAKAVYDEMRRRNIEPTAISFGIILRSYGTQRTEESIQIAEDFVRRLKESPELDKSWDRPTYGRKSALEHIYGPLLRAYSQQQRLEDVERVFRDLVDNGGTPSLGILATLLDAYRRAFDIDSVVQLWPQIWEMGLSYSNLTSSFADGDGPSLQGGRQSNILCAPLSIYIDALSSAGRHTEIAAVWKQMQDHGFTFDSHNWNHLVIALVRAGEPERAFEVIEKVILPYQRQTQHLNTLRDPTPDTPLAFEIPAKSIPTDDVTEVPPEPPMRRPDVRAKTAHLASRVVSSHPEFVGEENEGDLARPLEILHKVSPAWNRWRPHQVSLSVLLTVLCRLRSGFLVTPVGDSAAVGTAADGGSQQQALRARKILERIYVNYPDTVRRVQEHELAERRRLGADYDRAYNWR